MIDLVTLRLWGNGVTVEVDSTERSESTLEKVSRINAILAERVFPSETDAIKFLETIDE